MFDSNPARDEASIKTTRRVFLFGAGAVALSAVVLAIRRPPGVEASTALHGLPGQVTVIEFTEDGHELGPRLEPKIVKTDGEWYRQLGPNSFRIARQADTETPGYGACLNEHRTGIFRCICCQLALFRSQAKFDSHTGWPSFFQPIAPQNIVRRTDRSLGMARTEVLCARCDAHLGHVFDDGPEPSGLRFCVNSASLEFIALSPTPSVY